MIDIVNIRADSVLESEKVVVGDECGVGVGVKWGVFFEEKHISFIAVF